jgi:hypothetical protein
VFSFGFKDADMSKQINVIVYALILNSVKLKASMVVANAAICK